MKMYMKQNVNETKIIIYDIEWFLAVFNAQLISFIKMCVGFYFSLRIGIV